jgi:hypothetical protein
MTDPKTWKRAAGAAGLLATGLVAGGILTGTLTANAADTGTTASPESSTSGSVDPSQPQRSDEQLLTGDTKTKVEEAVLAKYPGATIERTETDSDGVYESHIVTADGQHVIVQVGEDFAVTGTQTGMGGMGGGPGGHHGPDGDADDSGSTDSGAAGGSGGA